MNVLGEEPPYRAEYAKSGRSSCRLCGSIISQDSLRIAVMVVSKRWDGKQPNWHHFNCFFSKYTPACIDEVYHFHDLRWDDQQRIKSKIEGGSGGKNKRRVLKNYSVQYALSGKSNCAKCHEKIEKDEVRIAHKEIHPERPQLGFIDRWHHAGCFSRRRREMGWKDGVFLAEMLTGFKAIDPADRETLIKLLNKKKKRKETPEGEIKDLEEIETDGIDPALRETLKRQSENLWKIIDAIKTLGLKKPELADILTDNAQDIPVGVDKVRERVADGMLYGRVPRCADCKGQLVATNQYYKCYGSISGWTGCTNITYEVTRTPWTIPSKFRECYQFFANYRYKAEVRAFPPRPKPKPLKSRVICIFGVSDKKKEELQKIVSQLGGTATTSVSKAYCCISEKEALRENAKQAVRKKIKEAELQDVFIVSEEFLDSLKGLEPQSSYLPMLKKTSITGWGSERKIIQKTVRKEHEEDYRGGEAKKLKLLVKSGAAVDPESGLERTTQVFQGDDGKKYTATLSMVDTTAGVNSYYKLQLLVSGTGKTFYVFRSWGRVGTATGGTKVEDFYTLEKALSSFNFIYFDKTGNEFGSKEFVKLPYKFFPLDIDYGADDEEMRKNLDKAGSNSRLLPSVKDLVRRIFDIASMKKAMLEFEIDLTKLPLGKLSKKQMQRAYALLTEITEIISAEPVQRSKVMDFSNRFYTLIPHDFGYDQPPCLESEDLIKAKSEMLDNLLEIEAAYSLLAQKRKEDLDKDLLDVNYDKLKCTIAPLERDSIEFKNILDFACKTHASTHDQYTLIIEDIFKIERQGEASRFAPFKQLHNRMLLWHGSRATNYAGILSQGLRIAPPEAPITGYMFGKGIYFADMVSKSANYCSTSRGSNIGFALLADVALGNALELTDAKNVKKLPKGKHSVKGIGRTQPNEETFIRCDDGLVIPSGVPVEADLSNYDNYTSLLYNEYIVYDIAQVNIKYLVKFKFDYKVLY